MVAVFEVEIGGGVLGECLLGELNSEVSVWTPISFKRFSEEEVFITHEVSGNFLFGSFLKRD